LAQGFCFTAALIMRDRDDRSITTPYSPETQPLSGADRELNVADITVSERPLWSWNGFLALLAMGGFAGFALITFLANIEHNPAIVGFFAPSMLLLCFVLGGFRVVSPNEAYVATFCGSYKGVLRKHGLRYVFPLFKTKMVSLRLMNFESPTVKVNDLGGCPVDMRAVVVWRVVDPAQAVYHVQNLDQFVKMQTETGIRALASQYPYDTGLSGLGEGATAEVTLRNGGELVADVLRTLVQRRMRIAGVEVVEARISHLAYAQEIASSMLMRQQASAVIAARRQVVDGAVGIAKDTLLRIENEITALEPGSKGMILTNVLTALISEHNVQPVLSLPTSAP